MIIDLLYTLALLLCAGFFCYGITFPEQFQRRRRVQAPADTPRLKSVPAGKLKRQGS